MHTKSLYFLEFRSVTKTNPLSSCFRRITLRFNKSFELYMNERKKNETKQTINKEIIMCIEIFCVSKEYFFEINIQRNNVETKKKLVKTKRQVKSLTR